MKATKREDSKDLIERLKAAIEPFHGGYRPSAEEVMAQYRLAMETRERIEAEPAGFSGLESSVGGCLLGWLLDLPYELARHELVTEAGVLGARFAEVIEPENFLGDRAVILAESGLRTEAVVQAEENLARFPEDPWIVIKAGDVYWKIGETARAEALYRQGLDLAGDDRFTRDGALERLFPLLEEMGRTTEVEALIEAEEGRNRDAAGRAPAVTYGDSPERGRPNWDGLPFVRQSPRVGRNDPCPCGSGKKYKKCCLGKGAPP